MADSLPRNIASCLYRIAQETLANIMKHAHADRVELELTCDDQEVTLSIRDNGVGFNLEQIQDHHLGLGLVKLCESALDPSKGDSTFSPSQVEAHTSVCRFHSSEHYMKKPRVLLADDHTFVLEGFKKLLEEHCELVGAVKDGRALIETAIHLKPDIVILDISMPRLNGIEAAKKLRTFLE